ncbi:Sec-independent protein translocase subunit TatA [Mycolicibacterium confluentis]|uniref:Sec-independent protein translocase protein TatA n=1 Tax=Mycolicibacterium confluentis TaxID=28047 RepID=A0A7I7XXW6_9MYCO|nr:Sec-independent protein translocase subunit TatA [Mycolicibacterium confluentis]MCV7321970.1 Sec-independent protein translocase subunit TatA [Mycolicibacterium confluentis]ORV32212.1 preprotein translocase subunit TatA [Mycolicibacterium confluentis]BBZ33793.1 Sec-independent protein translocase protein TatA [Mycolicibacterium confluentis]
MGALSPWHWAVLAIVIILLFGAKRLPDAARSLGKSLRIFKAEVKELQSDKPEQAPTQVQSERVAEPAPNPEPNHTDARPA